MKLTVYTYAWDTDESTNAKAFLKEQHAMEALRHSVAFSWLQTMPEDEVMPDDPHDAIEQMSFYPTYIDSHVVDETIIDVSIFTLIWAAIKQVFGAK